MTKTAEVKVINIVESFVTRGYQKDGNYSFVAGALESMLVQALEDLPKAKRQSYIDRMIEMQNKFFTK
jgi:hypothetical protein